MNKISKIVTGLNLQDQVVSQTREELKERVTLMVNHLFESLTVLCPGSNLSRKDTEQIGLVKRQWVLGLMDAKITDFKVIKGGFERLRQRDSDFLPSVGNFIKLCAPDPEAMGLPSVRKAFDEACKNSHPCSDKVWSHATVKHAWAETGANYLWNEAKTKSFLEFEKNYLHAIKLFDEGKILDQLPSPEKVSTPIRQTKEVAMSHLSMLKQSLGMRVAS